MYHRIKQLMLLAIDFTMLWTGFYVALAARHNELPSKQINDLTPYMLPLYGLAVIILFIAGLYDIGKVKNNASLYKRLGISAGVWVIISVLFFYTNFTTSVTPKTILLLNTVFGFGLITIWRGLYHTFISKTFLTTGVIFVGMTKETKEIIELLHAQPEHGYRVLGCITTDTEQTEHLLVPRAATLKELLAKTTAPDIIVIAPTMATSTVLNGLYSMLFQQVGMVNLVDFYERIFGRVPPFAFSESWFVTNLQEQRKKIYDRGRILFDYAVALVMGLFFLITFPFIAIATKLNSRGPILFKQTRIGRGEKPFTMYKYRTMQALTKNGSAEVGGPQFAAENDSRVTMVGKILRSTRFDELPQFWNILKGEMGLIGPRPERPEFVSELTKQMPFYSLRHLIKPGLTGWAQLQQSYYGDIKENLLKLQYDLFYVKNRGLLLDVAIILRTINILVRFMGR